MKNIFKRPLLGVLWVLIVAGCGTTVDQKEPSAPQKRIFILGSSTVHAGNYLSGNYNDPYGSNRKLEGWGEQIGHYLKDPSKVYNRARSGADSVTYRNPDPLRIEWDGFKNRDWGYTENLIKETNDNNGGFLLIQFGANDEAHHIGEVNFKNELKAYIADAKRLGLTPVLLSPPNHRNHHPSRHYTGWVGDVATAEDVLYLNLNAKSISVWEDYDENNDYNGDGVDDNNLAETLPEADIIYGYLEHFRGINNAHMSPTGANIVAGWVKELACGSTRDDGKLLCSQFLTERKTPNSVPPVISVVGKATVNVMLHGQYTEKGAKASDDIDKDISDAINISGTVDPNTLGTYTITYSVSDSSGNQASTKRTINVINPTVAIHEDAEDGDTAGWSSYGQGANPSIDNDFDPTRGNHVIILEGDDGTENGFNFPVQVTEGFVASWSLKAFHTFRFFVQIRTENRGNNVLYMEYGPTDIGTRVSANGNYVYHGLGRSARDGTWHTFTRDIAADLKTAYPNDHITSIVGFSIRGSSRIDDISTSTRAPSETFAYNGHIYKIVKHALSWQEASDAAQADGGHLAKIESSGENHEIFSRLNRFITQGEYAQTKASNGGEASYVWIGANDLTTEGKWVWRDSSQQFWSGIRNGHPENGFYNNWGRKTDRIQMEPDNSGNQDAAGMAITEWALGSGHLGQASQWNDLKAIDALYYIIEYE